MSNVPRQKDLPLPVFIVSTWSHSFNALQWVIQFMNFIAALQIVDGNFYEIHLQHFC